MVPHDKVQQLVRDSREGKSWGKEEARKVLEEQAGRRVSDNIFNFGAYARVASYAFAN